jgi:hypothetical protein
MTEITMGISDIIAQMKNGAKLHRGFGDKIELRLASGVVSVPIEIFDSLIDQNQIVEQGGFQRRVIDPRQLRGLQEVLCSRHSRSATFKLNLN